MDNGIDISHAVAADEASERVMALVSDLYKDYAPDVVETSVERALLEIRDTKARMYASILAKEIREENAEGPKEQYVEKTGTVEDMTADLQKHGVAVDMK